MSGNMPAGVLVLAARCPACGRQAGGMASSCYPGLITVDYHLFPVARLGLCIGSRSAGQASRHAKNGARRA